MRREQIGFIFQNFNLIGDLNIHDNVELPLTYRGFPKSERHERVEDALERVGMSHRAKHMPYQLSGGQQQRVAVARAVVGDSLILLADEPTGNLDSTHGEQVMGLLAELHEGGSTLCMVTHDPRYIRHAELAPNLSVDGRIVLERLKDVLYTGRPAFGQPDSRISLFVLEDGGVTAKRTLVVLGGSSVSEVQILEGLDEGDRVILSDMSEWDAADRIELD